MSNPKIGFLGIGLMGRPMARRLHDEGFQVTIWNRSAERVSDLVAFGMRSASLRETVADSDIVITMLSDGGAVTSILFDDKTMGGLIGRPRRPIVIDMSSIPPALARSHSEALAKVGVSHLDAPVSGGTRGAQSGSLAIMVGGDEHVFEAARMVLNALGRATLVGPSGAGQLAKLANQIIVGTTIAAISEALLLAQAGGADPVQVRQALAGGFADSPILREHGQRMLDRNFEPGGLLRTQVKDLRTIMAEAEQIGIELPLTARTASLFEDAMTHGLSERDHSALFLELERRNGQPRRPLCTSPVSD